ncbi:pseudouridylate synthase, partial [Xanthomonas perforans]
MPRRPAPATSRQRQRGPGVAGAVRPSAAASGHAAPRHGLARV